jgi:hypothetical protein
MEDDKQKQYLQESKKKSISESRKLIIFNQCQYHILTLAEKRFNLLRVRQKLSFTALYRRQTIKEMFFIEILKLQSKMEELGMVTNAFTEEEMLIYDSIMRNDPDALKLIVAYKFEDLLNVVREKKEKIRAAKNHNNMSVKFTNLEGL